MMWVFLVAAVVGQFECDSSKSNEDNLNPDCNWSLCVAAPVFSVCVCCDTSKVNVEDDYCKGASASINPGTWSDDSDDAQCVIPTVYINLKFSIHILEGMANCSGIGSTPDILNDVRVVVQERNYSGLIVAQECADETDGILLTFGTDLNTYYNRDCAQSDLSIPVGKWDCEENKDFGAEGHRMIFIALDEGNDFSLFRASLEEKLGWSSAIDEMHVATLSNQGSSHLITRQPTSSPSHTDTLSPSHTPTFSPSHTPTFSPSTPTFSPSLTPTLSPSKTCDAYVNKPTDLKWLGGGLSCRARMNESWTGGRSCDSPYIVCLPEENTPAFDIMGNRYKNDTHRYTVDECKLECSYDQSCLGIEFVPDNNGSWALGACVLLSIEPEVEDADQNKSACYSKRDYCNPYFEAEDLSDEMLSCYCPNNRKGVYTKKVKRIMNNTRFCDNDSSVDERIRLAQANRMFHLCENWCLFETHNPEQENWYWDPWKQCWRETYSGTGVHRSYCDRVIRNPNSIELQFLNFRRTHFCVSNSPTSSPVSDVNTTWYLAASGESCDGVCGRNEKVCAAEQTTRGFKTEVELITAFSETGQHCESVTMNNTNFAGWALPGIRAGSRCVNRQPTIDHLSDLDSDCRRKIGNRWQRLCACY